MVSVGASWFLYIFIIHSYSYTTYSFLNSKCHSCSNSFCHLKLSEPASFSIVPTWTSTYPLHPDTGCSLQDLIEVRRSHLLSYMEVGSSLSMYICWQSPNCYWNGWKKHIRNREKLSKKLSLPLSFRLRTLKVCWHLERVQHGNAWVSRDPLKCQVPGKM